MALRATRPSSSPRGRPDDLERLARALDMAKLVALGWDPVTRVFAPDGTHPLLGYSCCRVEGCDNEGICHEQLCAGCAARRKRQKGLDIEQFCTAGPGPATRVPPRACLVCRLPGKERPSAGSSGLCRDCESVRASRGQSVEDFLAGDGAYPPASARRGYGVCKVEACERLAAHKLGLCDAHHQAWRGGGRPELGAFARRAVSARRDNTGRVAMAGLPEGVVLEVLLGIQAALADGRKLRPPALRSVVMHLRSAEAQSVTQLDPAKLPSPVREFLRLAASEAGFARSSLEAEYEKDVWDLRHWGKRGQVSFAGGSALK
ncbi:MAG: hypothetical protein ACRDZX_14520, partial [Acidimicrobiales bacterium]